MVLYREKHFKILSMTEFWFFFYSFHFSGLEQNNWTDSI